MKPPRTSWVLALCALLVGCSDTAQVPSKDGRPDARAGASATPTAAPTSTGTPTTTSDAAPSAPESSSGTPVPDALPRSRSPRLPYVDGTVLRRPDGSSLGLDLPMSGAWGITSVVPYADGYLVTDDRWFEGTVGMHRVGPRGHARVSWASTGPGHLGPFGQVALMTVPVPEALQEGPAVLQVDGRVQRLPGHLEPRILQFDGALVVYAARVRRPDGRYVERAFETAVPGRPRPVAMPQAADVSPRLRHWWRWDDGVLELGRGDASLVRLRDRGIRQSSAQPAWEDERHVLVTYVRGGRQALLRVGVDGSVTRTTRWVPETPAGHAVLPRVT